MLEIPQRAPRPSYLRAGLVAPSGFAVTAMAVFSLYITKFCPFFIYSRAFSYI